MNVARSPLIAFNKPYNTLCQFRASQGQETLSRYIKAPGYYPAGRLDRDSEGLLLLTNDGKLQHRISHPKHKLGKRYLVQVDGLITQSALDQLCTGVSLNDGPAAADKLSIVQEPDWLWPRTPPVRFRKAIPTSWIDIIISEGRNRQIRRMTAAAGFPTLRLIRVAIGRYELGDLGPGDYRYVTPFRL